MSCHSPTHPVLPVPAFSAKGPPTQSKNSGSRGGIDLILAGSFPLGDPILSSRLSLHHTGWVSRSVTTRVTRSDDQGVSGGC